MKGRSQTVLVETENTLLSVVLEFYAKIKDRCIAKPVACEKTRVALLLSTPR